MKHSPLVSALCLFLTQGIRIAISLLESGSSREETLLAFLYVEGFRYYRSGTPVHLFFSRFSTIQGRIDQVNQVLELDKESVCGVRYAALDRWTRQLDKLQQAVLAKMA